MLLELTERGDLQVRGRLLRKLKAQAAAARPQECCGLLLGKGGRIAQAVPTLNVHPNSATHFEIDPQVLIDAYRAEREGGPQVLGYYHSHPTGNPSPSQTDREMAAHDGKVWAIIAADGIMFWQDNPEGFSPLSYEVLDR